MRLGLLQTLFLQGTLAGWKSKENRCDKVIEFLAHEGRLTVDNRVFRRMDEFRTKLYTDIEQAAKNCTSGATLDETARDAYDVLKSDDERMDFENLDNKISKCVEGFRFVIAKVLPSDICVNANQRNLRKLLKLTNQLTYAKERVMKRKLRASMRSRNPDKVRPLSPEMLAEREAKRARKASKQTARIENESLKENRILERQAKQDKKAEKAEQKAANEVQKAQDQAEKAENKERKEMNKELRADTKFKKEEKRIKNSEKEAEKATKQAEKELANWEREIKREDKKEKKETSQTKKEAKQAKKSDKVMKKTQKLDE